MFNSVFRKAIELTDRYPGNNNIYKKLDVLPGSKLSNNLNNPLGKTNRLVFMSIVLTSLCTFGSIVDGQDQPGSQRQRILDEPFRLQMDRQIPANKRLILDWGGWFRSNYWYLDENVDRDHNGHNDGSRGYRQQQLRLWGRLNIDQVHQFYVRGKLDYMDWNHHSSYNHNDSDWQGPQLERGWYDFRLSRAQWAYGNGPGKFDLALRIGRQYVEFGTGLALSVPLDAVVMNGYYDNWQLTSMGAMSIPSSYNIDRSIPGVSKEDRRFWGLQLRYNGWRDHRPFAYFFSQDDVDSGHMVNGQKFGYNSRYAGLGSRGKFFLRDLQYTVEAVSEFGHSYANNSTTSQAIKAWAFDTELRYFFPDKHLSQVALEYLWASGDQDRQLSPANTMGGNRIGTNDNSFSAWGYRNTGLTLAPLMSNLGMVRLGASTFPARQHKYFRELKIGTNLFVYHKVRSQGAASDTLSTNDSSYLGSAMDLYSDWRITSDLSWMVRYGIFLPGKAFDSESARQLFFTGLTLSF